MVREAVWQLAGVCIPLFRPHCHPWVPVRAVGPEQIVYFFREVVGVAAVTKEVLSERTGDYQGWVEAFARNHEVPIEWGEKGVRKEEYVRRLDQLRITMIDEAPRQALQNVGPLFHFAQKNTTPIRTDPPPIEPPYHPPPSKTVKVYPLCATLCVHKAVLVYRHNLLIQNILCHEVRLLPYHR
jgi:hypothetical protein